MTPSYSARTVYKEGNLKDFKIETYFQIRLILLTVQMHKHHMNYKRVVIWHRFTRFNSWTQSLILGSLQKLPLSVRTAWQPVTYNSAIPGPQQANTWLGACRDSQCPGLLEMLQSCLLVDSSLLLTFIHSYTPSEHIPLFTDSWSQYILIHQYHDNEGNVLFPSVLLTFLEHKFSEEKKTSCLPQFPEIPRLHLLHTQLCQMQ